MENRKIAIYWRNPTLGEDAKLKSLVSSLEAVGFEVAYVNHSTGIAPDTDFLLSVGGDGTFLSSAMLVGDKGIPVLGVNFGRMGFLSEAHYHEVAEALVKGEYAIEDRALLDVRMIDEYGQTGEAAMAKCFKPEELCLWHYALNEISLHRGGAAMLGVDVSIDGMELPTYWADGLLVATSSGSTAYSLSVGGPIVMPAAKVLIISPISPHNLNVRPMIVPDTSKMRLSLRSRKAKVNFTMDARTMELDGDARLEVSMAQFSLKRLRLNTSNFINALTGKLFWGEDIRNTRGK